MQAMVGGVPYLEAVVERLCRALRPERIVLFGSWARGDARPDSDLDLLVIAPSTEPIHERMARAQRALRGLPVAADVFVVTPQEAARYSRWLGHTVTYALQEGVTVYG